MTMPASTPPTDLALELELIRWKHASFERITGAVEDALPELMADIDRTVTSMPFTAVGRAQVSSNALWEKLFAPWAHKVAIGVEAEMEKEINMLAATLPEEGNRRDALRVALPALAGVGMLAASLAAIPSVISMATITTTSFFFFTTTAVSWPVLAAGGVGIAVATLTGSRVVERLSDQNRAHLVTRLQSRARVAALGHGRAPGERCLVTDLQAATLRKLEAELVSA